ncbi:MAG: cadmium-translocating P-type ATPase [Gemmatimonadetes bacterium]|nr:cadmium-translocating P-type ATPase [Gemmatimonadota bacterium]
MTEFVRLDLPVLLPGVQDDQDACVARLVALLEARDGIGRVHVTHEHGAAAVEHDAGTHPDDGPPAPGALCVHYDPARISLGRITELAESAGATITQRFGHAVIPFRAVGAEDGGTRIEAALRSLPGVTAAVVNFPAQLVRVEFDTGATTIAAVREALVGLGAPTAGLDPDAAPDWYARHREIVWSVAGGAFTLAGALVGRVAAIPAPVAIALYGVAYFFGARDLLGHLASDLRRRHFRFNIDLLMVVAAAGAAVLGAWAEGALLLFLFSMGHALEHYAMGRARNAIRALAELAPQTATVRRGGADRAVPIGQVRSGDLVVVRPGERVSVDGIVREGRSAVNQAPITGESAPVDKQASDKVFAGSVNGEGVLVVEVSAAVGDRTLDRIIKLVAEAETQKAPTQQFTDRFERVFVPVVLAVDVLLIVVPPLVGLWTWSDAFYRAMALLVAASPCALALGTPAAVLAGIAQAARNGVLIKGGAHLEALGCIDTIALDKTGTITRGEPAVTDLVPGSAVGDTALLTLAAALEQQSQHPVARAIVRAAEARALAVPVASDVQAVTGRGLRARVDGAVVEVGRLALFDDATGTPPASMPATIREAVRRLEAAGRTTMVVRAAGRSPEWLGVIGVADEPRDGIRETLAALRQMGIGRIVMLTGDNAGVADTIGRAVGLDDVRADLMPEDKVAAIRQLASQGRVAMVGDGVNDAPALAHATVGIAMGGAGTAAALETADVALMSDDLSRLPFAVGLCRAARSVIRQNLLVSLSVIAVLAVATIGGWARIGPAVIVHEGSTLVVIGNALRLLRYREGGVARTRPPD